LPFTTDLTTKSDLLPFYSIVAAKLGKSKPKLLYTWSDNFRKNRITATNDSLKLNGTKVIFTLYSHFEKNKLDKKHLKKLDLIFPNQGKAGSYYNMPCFGIIKQARNYNNAQLFLRYLLFDNVNKRLNKRLKMFPIILEKQSSYPYQQQPYKKTAVSPIQQTKHFTGIFSFIKNN
jgi:ABC-type Fe3+ transport system substrate-binding protein